MANDLYFNIMANQRQASEAMVKFAESIEYVVDKVKKLDGQNATVDVKVKTDESQKALDSFSTRFQLMAAGILVGSPAIGAAITAGVGAGFIGLAVLAQKSNEQVKQTYTTLWQNVVQDTRQATNQIVPQIVAAGNQIGHSLEGLAPQMHAAFSAAGPDIVALSRGVTSFAQNAMPGLVSSMQNSLPIFGGLASLLGTLGTAFGDTVASIGQHSQAYAGFLTSLGSITQTVLALATRLINTMAEAWSANGTQIAAAISGLATVIGGLAEGVLPVLNAALRAAANFIAGVTAVLGPLAPILGTVGAGAIALWGAFKLAEGATVAIKALGLAVANMGASMQTGAAKAAIATAEMNGVKVEASATAVAMRAAGVSASTAATGFGLAATTLAGPLGIALAIGAALFIAFSSGADSADSSTKNLKVSLDGVTSALEASNGAIDASVIKSLQSEQGFKDAADKAKQFGIAQSDISAAVIAGGPALDGLRKQLQAIVDANHEIIKGRTGRMDIGLNQVGKDAQAALDGLNSLKGGFADSGVAAQQNTKALEAHGNELLNSRDGHLATSSAAKTLGVSVGYLSNLFLASAVSTKDANASIEQIAATSFKAALQIASATGAISDHFKQADQAVASATASAADAQHSYEQSSRAITDARHSEAAAARGVQQAEQGVADAQHGVITAQRGIRDATEGVTLARNSYIKAQEQEKIAEQGLSDARQQAVRDLKALHQQLDDQYTSEASARVRLFDAQQTAMGAGINSSNAHSIAGQTVTGANVDRVKIAIDLLSAQNGLNSALSNGANLRQDVAKADAAGVDNSRGVISAQQSLRSAQDQVASSAKGVQKAQEQLSDATYGLDQAQRGLKRAHQGVTDAAYAQTKAHQGVADAQYQNQRASAALKKANDDLKIAHDNASRSLDLNTDAGRKNLALTMQLWDSINSTGLSTLDKQNAAVDQVATAFGMSKDRASDYLKQLGLIPKDFKYDVTAVASVDTAGLASVFKGTNAGGYFNNSMNQQKTVGGTGYAEGGQVRGPGGTKGDKIPAWLSDYEYVHQADAVGFWGVDFMDDVNNKRVPRKLLPGFADGGLAHWNAVGAGAGAAYVSTVNAQTIMGLPHPAQLPKYVAPVISAYGGGAAGASYIPTGQHLMMIDLALAADGIPRGDWPRWEAGMNVLIQRESSWNANSLNTWDSNAKAGHPSGGLTQTIATTFEGNRNRSLPDNMFDPVANIAASINYIRGRYGDISNVQQANPNMPHKGYAGGGHVRANTGSLYGMNRPGAFDNGGSLQPGWTPVYNGTGRPENVRTAAAEDKIVDGLNQVVRAIATLAKRPMQVSGEAVMDTGKVIGVLRDATRILEHEGGVGLL